MKKFLGRFGIFAFACVFASLPIATVADEADRTYLESILSKEYVDNLSDEQISEYLSLGDINPGYIDDVSEGTNLPDIGGAYEISEEDILSKAGALPSYYDPRKQNLGYKLPPIRNQGIYGTCWAHAAIASMEIDLIKNHNFPNSIDLSERQLVYFAYNHVEDPLKGLTGYNFAWNMNASGYSSVYYMGGNYKLATNMLLDWIGIADEKEVPSLAYSSTFMSASPLDSSLAFENPKAHLKGYFHYGVPSAGDAVVKAMVKEYGAVQAAYYIESLKDNAYYNAQTASQYMYTTQVHNHSITIIGWDDDYAVSNFKTAPPAPGAWICRNSYGTSYGENGYFYLSYYDKNLSEVVAYDAMPADEYDNVYQYDGLPLADGVVYREVGTVYKIRANENGAETIDSVTFEASSISGSDIFTIDIYTYLTNPDDPSSGTLVGSYDVLFDKIGIGTVNLELDNPIYVEESSYIGIVARVSGNGTSYLLCDLNSEDEYTSTSSRYITSYAVNYRSDFLYRTFIHSGNTWKKNTDGDVRIKVYTSNVAPKIQVAVNSLKIKTNEDTVSVNQTLTLDTQVSPANANNRSLIYYSSDESIASVSENGEVTGHKTGKVTITVKSLSNPSVTDSVTLTVIDPITSFYGKGPTTIMTEVEKTLELFWYPENSKPVFTAESADESILEIVSVSKNKVVYKGKKAGTVNLYVYEQSGSKMRLAATINVIASRYTVLFDANGGTGNTSPMYAIDYGKTYSLNKNKYSNAGYVFAGWNTKADGSGTMFVDGEKISNLSTVNNSTVTLYAQWAKKIVKPGKFSISSVTCNDKGTLIKWGKSSNAKFYYIYRKAGSGKYELIGKVKSSKKSFVDTDKLVNGKKYTYKVQALSETSFVDCKKAVANIYMAPVKIERVINSSSKTAAVLYELSKKAKGYQIQYSTNSKFKSAKTVNVNEPKTKMAIISKLGKKKYYVRVRAYAVSGKNKYYGVWSDAATVKITR